MSLETNIQKLESLVAVLESEDSNLDTAIETYTEVLGLAKQTFDMLQAARITFTKLTDDHGHLFEESIPLGTNPQ
jgi:exodeoxyribonuclease VII small subunit